VRSEAGLHPPQASRRESGATPPRRDRGEADHPQRRPGRLPRHPRRGSLQARALPLLNVATRWQQQADLGRVERSVLEHPFCSRWAAGELRPEELAAYASEYDHAAAAVAAAAARAAELDPRFATAAAEERRQLGCWREFSRAVGWGGMAAWRYAEEPLPETVECARV